MKISILGSGNFGTALAKVFSKKNSVNIYSIDKKAVDNINNLKINKDYLPKIKLNKNIIASTDISSVKNSDIIVFCVPSSVFKIVSKQLKPYYHNQIIVSASKGIAENGEVLTDIIEKQLKCNSKKVLALSGPSIAKELAEGKPTQVILGGNRKYTQIVKNVFKTKTFFIRNTRDKEGIQYLGFYKNILAVLVGLCDGLKLGNNFKAALVTKAYSEFYYLNQNKNIRRHSFIDYAGLGDMYVTSTCLESRNRRFGFLLAKASSINQVKKEIGQVIEGYENLKRLSHLKKCDWFETNLIKILIKIINSRSQERKKQLLLKYLHSSEIKALVFDWGNVLTKDYYSMHVAKVIAKEYNLNSNFVLEVLEKNEQKLLLGKESFKSFFKNIKKEIKVIKYDFFIKAYKNSITWNKEVFNICEKLSKQYNLYILSNNYDIVVPLIKPRLKKIFNGMIFSNEVHKIKPNNAIFTHLLNKYHLRPENCIYVDDSHANILAAQRNKFNVVEFDNVKKLHQILSKTIIGFKK